MTKSHAEYLEDRATARHMRRPQFSLYENDPTVDTGPTTLKSDLMLQSNCMEDLRTFMRESFPGETLVADGNYVYVGEERESPYYVIVDHRRPG